MWYLHIVTIRRIENLLVFPGSKASSARDLVYREENSQLTVPQPAYISERVNPPAIPDHFSVYILANQFKQPLTFAESQSSLETCLLGHCLQSSSGAEGEEGEAGWRHCP